MNQDNAVAEALVDRLAQADKPTRELLEETAFVIANGWWSEERAARYHAMLDAEAWTSAVEMLVPEGWTADVRRYPDGKGNAVLSEWSPPCRAVKSIGDASPALALAIACLKARGL